MNAKIAALAMAALAILAAIYVLDKPSNSDVSTEPQVSDKDGIYAGPAYDSGQGSVVVTGFDGDTITFTAIPADGYQWSHWETSSGEILTTSTSCTFPADQDRDARAIFEPAGVRYTEYQWHVPTFNEDGTVSYDTLAVFALKFSTSEYNASVKDPSIQRASTNSNPSPAELCSDEGAVAEVVAYLETYCEGLSYLQKAMVVLCFVQDAIGYTLDSDQYDTPEFWATPYETLYSGYGDCEDTATLYVSIASAMGIDCGFVTFSSDRIGSDGSGHMSVAVRLPYNGMISGDGAAVFVIDGHEWAYCETAFDPDETGYRPMIGVLSDSYDIYAGTFAHITYDTHGYTEGSTVSIHRGGTANSGTAIYGSEWSNPPAVEMAVGDRFSYTPELSLPATITASGNGLSWLTWDSEKGILSGTAKSPGTYTVVLKAVSTVGPEQTATQTVTIVVTESTGDSDRTLVYGTDGWAVDVDGGDKGDENTDGDDGNRKVLLIVLIGFAVILAAAVVRRVI